jgi:hypothetical protein
VTSLAGSDLGLMLSMNSGSKLPERMLGVGADTIHVRFAKQGIEGGWADWPMNFDPVWLEWCTGFKMVDKDSLKLYTTKCFEGFCPVGTAAVVLAANEEEAERLLAEQLKEHRLDLVWTEDDPTKRFERVSLDKARAIVLNDGDY